MRHGLTSLLCLSLLALAACDTARSSDSAVLKGGIGELHFVKDAGGDQYVQFCRDGNCRKAPDNEYKTEHGLTVPVVNGRIKYAERPNLFCHYELKNDKEHIACEDRR